MEKNFTKNIDQPFGWEPNEIIFNPDLSLKAKGLWLYMNAKPDGWYFAAERIAEECADGATSVRTALKELAEFGLLTWKKKGDGRIIYTLESTSFPQKKHPDSENLNLGTDPDSENPKLGKPQIGESLTINNKEDNKERIIIKKEGVEAVSADSRPNSRLPVSRNKFDSENEYEKEFYRRNTVYLGAH